MEQNNESGAAKDILATGTGCYAPKGWRGHPGYRRKISRQLGIGTGFMTEPMATSLSRSGFGPQLPLSYDSGAGNGPIGFGWSFPRPSITCKMDKDWPQYCEAEESDIFILLSGIEDFVPILVTNHRQECKSFDSPASEPGYSIQRYYPRIEGLFARIKRWTDNTTRISHWRSITTHYGKHEDARIAALSDPTQLSKWSFEVVFEYGGHDPATPKTKEAQVWPTHQYPFHLYRATFKTRTYRSCRRVLMFHHFPGELGAVDFLGRSTDFAYSENLIASIFASAMQSSCVHQPYGMYLKESLLKLEFKYSEAHIDETVRKINLDSIENLPYGADSAQYQWVISLEVLTGAMTEQADTWLYKRNLGNEPSAP